MTADEKQQIPCINIIYVAAPASEAGPPRLIGFDPCNTRATLPRSSNLLGGIP